MDTEATQASLARKKSQPWWFQLWFQVLVAMVLGILLGHFYPALGAKMQPLGDGIYQSNSSAHCADHLLHRCARNIQHGQYGQGWPSGA